MNRKTDIPALALASLGTIGVHVGVVVLLMLFHSFSGALEREEEVHLPVIDTELLKWGEEMPDEHALPTIANPAPAPEPETVPEELPEPQPEAEPAPAEEIAINAQDSKQSEENEEQLKPEEERSEDAPAVEYRGEHNPNRPTNTERIQGSPEGFRGGTSLSEAAKRNQMSAIQEQLQRAFRPPSSISESELRRMQARFRIVVDASGRIIRWQLLSSSGNRHFDTTAEAVLNRFRHGDERLRLQSISNEALREQIIADGFVASMKGE